MSALAIIQIIIVVMLIPVLMLVSASDNANSIIPNKLSYGFGVLAFLFYLTQATLKSFWIPLVVVVCTFVALFLLFCLTGESLVGGGDMKLLLASLLMLNTLDLYMDYIMAICVFTFLGAIITLLKKEKSVRCGLYYSLAILSVVLLRLFPVTLPIPMVATILTSFALFASFFEIKLYDKERCFYDVQGFKEI